MGDNGLEDLVGDGRQDTLIVVSTDIVVDLGKFLWHRAEQDSEGDLDRLQVLCTGLRREQLRSRPNFEVVDLMKDRNTEVHAFTVDSGLQTPHGVHLESAMSTIDHEDELRHKNSGEENTTSGLQHTIEESFHVFSIFSVNYLS